jgi:uncharacterized MAPEG superfamily protein
MQISLELRHLIYVALLSAIVWLPYVSAHIATVGVKRAFSYPDRADMPAWAGRLKRAHYNLLENLPLFIVAVLAGELQDVHTGITVACARVFFWARVAHLIAAVSHIWGARTVTFAIGWVATLVYLFTVLVTP